MVSSVARDVFAILQPVRTVAIRSAIRAGGATLLALAALNAVALGSWRSDDPSLSYAVDAPVRNLLGFSGAAAADLAMQGLGLASLGLLAALAFLGWRLLLLRVPARPVSQISQVALAILLAAAALACLPVTGGWPLPTGLGGAAGDVLIRLPEVLFGTLAAGARVASFVLAAGLSVILLVLAVTKGETRLVPTIRARPAPRTVPQLALEEYETDELNETEGDESAERNGRLKLLAGWAAHLAMSAHAQIRRRLTAPRATVAAIAEREVALAASPLSMRHDPTFGGPAIAAVHAPAPREAAESVALQLAETSRTEGRRSELRRLEAKRAESRRAEIGGGEKGRSDYRRAVMGHERAIPVGGTRSNTRSETPGSPIDDAEEDRTDFETIDDGELDSGANFEQTVPAPTVAHRSAGAPAAPARPDSALIPIARNAPSTSPTRRATPTLRPAATVGADYERPSLDLLDVPGKRGRDPSLEPAVLQDKARQLEGVLEDFGVRGAIINIRPGPVVTLYELEPAPGIKSSRVIGLADDIARSMSAIAARVAVVPGRNVIGIELPNMVREMVFLREMLASPDFTESKARLALSLGKTIGGEPVIADLSKMPHLLVAGTTGSGKSVAINTMILSILYKMTPDECRLIMIDPKMLELSVYDGIPHLLTPVVTDPKKAVSALKWTVREMEERYRMMSKVGVRNIDGFNSRMALARKKGEIIARTVQTGFDYNTGEAIFETEELELEPMPYIMVVIDEMADLMMVAGKEIEGAVQRLAQMARAAGIHVIMATQRPSVDVITGTIKANFPTRISFQVTSKIDSRTILGEQGAEQLLGQGDMLYMAGGGRVQRVHGPFVSDGEVEDVVAHLKAQGAPAYVESVTDEDGDGAEDGGSPVFDASAMGEEDGGDLYERAVAVVLRDKKVSTSYIQRRLGIGYNRAASLIERMEKEGVIGAPNHAGKRAILRGEEGAAA